MDDDLTSALEEWHRITSQATTGPWSIDEKHGRDIADEHWSEIRIKDAEGDDVAATFISHLLEPGNSAQDEAFIITARTAMPRLLAAVEAVLADHVPVDRGRVMPCCQGCETVNGEFHEDCCHEWPCPTYEAITREITGKGDGDGA